MERAPETQLRSPEQLEGKCPIIQANAYYPWLFVDQLKYSPVLLGRHKRSFCCSVCPSSVAGACSSGWVTNSYAILVNPLLTLSVPQFLAYLTWLSSHALSCIILLFSLSAGWQKTYPLFCAFCVFVCVIVRLSFDLVHSLWILQLPLCW